MNDSRPTRRPTSQSTAHRPSASRPAGPLATLAMLLATLWTLTAPAVAQFPGGGFPGGGNELPGIAIGRVTATVEAPEPVGPGATTAITVRISIENSWHVQAGAESGQATAGYIPTTVALSLPEGWSAGTPVWPRAREYTLGSGSAAVRFNGYEGTIAVTIPVTAPADAVDGEVPFTATVGYQACDDVFCEPPDRVTARGSLRVSRDEAAAAVKALADAASDRFADDVRLATELRWYEGDVLLPGREASLGVVLRVAPGWHIQAGEGSGDAGPEFIATTIELDLPEGWTAGAVIWPEATPEGWYAGTTTAIVPVRVPEDAAAGERPVSARVGYQACDEAGLCEFPAEASATGTVRVAAAGEQPPAAEPLPAELAEAFAATFKAMSDRTKAAGGDDEASEAGTAESDGGFDVKKDKWWVSLVLVFAALGWAVAGTFRTSRRTGLRLGVLASCVLVAWGSLAFVRGITADSDVQWVHYTHAAFEEAADRGDTVFIKFTADWCANCQVNERIILGNETAVAELTRPGVTAMKVDFTQPDAEGDEKKAELGGGGIPLIAVYPADGGEPVALRGQLVDAGPVIAALRGETIAEGDATRQVFDVFGRTFTVARTATLLIMFLAFVAGFLMNFTPCVLPVIPIKILSLQAHAKDPARCLLLGLVFSAGIVALYAGLGVLMAGLVGGIERMDWGKHFENWWLNAIIAVIILAMGVGMMGVFEIRLPSFLSSFSPQSDSAKGSFFMGVFTAILSTPCTGPLLGATVAWTATQPPAIAFTTLVVMGAGMAFPYIVLTAFPKLLQKMPKAGPGSEVLKQVMGLFMLAVAVWFGGTALAALGG
jgi:cytochrome c biogenesis protein CcdA/DsbC/DsbD-like thiol-disulfide interchange protein